MIIVYSIIFLVSLVIFYRTKLLFLSILPAILLIMDAGFTFFASNSIITYSKATLIFLFIFYSFNKIGKYIIYNRAIFAFILFCLMLFLFTEELAVSSRNSIKALPPMLFFFIGIHYYKKEDNYLLLLKSFIILIFISVAFASFGYVFGIGQTYDYGDFTEEVGYVGLLQGGNYYPVSIAIIIVFVLISDKYLNISPFKKFVLIITTAVCYLFIVLTMRRTSILLPALGIFIVILSNPKIVSKTFLNLSIIVFIFILLLPLYEDVLFTRFEVRAETGRFEKDFYETENRYLETIRIFEKTFSFTDLKHSLIGTNVLAGGWEGGEAHRMHHTDHAQLLDTTGIIGFTLYFMIYISFFRYYLRFKRIYKRDSRYRNINSLFLSTILITIVTGLNGSMFIVTFRTTAFLFLGACVGILNSKMIKYKTDKNVRKQHYLSIN